MFRYHKSVTVVANIIINSVIMLAAMLLSFHLRVYLVPCINSAYIPTPDAYHRALLVLIPLCHFCIYFSGLYPMEGERTLRKIITAVVRSNLYIGLFYILFSYAMRINEPGRLSVLFFVVFNLILFSLKEALFVFLFRKAREKGMGRRNLLIIGDLEMVPKIIEEVTKDAYLGLQIAGFYPIGEMPEHLDRFDGVKRFDPEKDIHFHLLENHIDNVIIAVKKENLVKTEDLLLECEEFGAEIWMYADFFELMFARKEIGVLGEMPVLIFRTTPQPSWTLMCKRLIDIVGSMVLAILFSPVMLFAVAGTKLSSFGPIIFKQKRVGLHGRKFVFYKFRTMITDAEQRRGELIDRNIMEGPVFKVKDDPRITPFGKFLRTTSIDEFPQLWNVFKGEMSLVGPRPPLPPEVAKYRGWQRRRLSMKPGLTCLWQVEGRNKITDFAEWARLDLKYIDNWSLGLDFIILCKTVFVVLFRIGAE